MTPIENPAQPATPLLPALLEARWSPKKLLGKPFPHELTNALFEAARWAPSSRNEQPWRYIYAYKDDGEAREKLESLLVESNGWAKEAYLLMISFGKRTHVKNARPDAVGRGKENRYDLHDTGQANAYLVLQATALGLQGHQMGGFDVENANKVLGVSDDFIPASMIAVGYPPEAEDLPEPPKERTRHPVSEFVFRGEEIKAINENKEYKDH